MGGKAGKELNISRRRTRSSTAAEREEAQKSTGQLNKNEPENASPRKRAKLDEESSASREELLARAIEAMHEANEQERSLIDPASASTSIEASATEEVPTSAEVLVTIPGAKVHLVEKEQAVLLASGEFSITRINQNGGVVAVFVKVGEEQQWPLAKDSPALKLSENYYVFSLRVPLSLDDIDHDQQEAEIQSEDQSKEEILNYGVVFEADDKNQELLKELDKILSSYSSFVPVPALLEDAQEGSIDLEETLAVVKAEEKRQMPKKSDYYWKQLAPPVEYESSLAQSISSGSGQIVKGIIWMSELIATQIERSGLFMKQRITPKRKPTKISPKTMKNVQRAKRVSKMTENLATSLLSGVVTATGSITSSVLKSKAGAKLFGMLPGEAALATFDAFVRVFDALELAGKNVMSRTSLVTCQIVSHRYGDEAAALTKEGLSTAGHVVSTAWTISKLRTAIDPTKVPKK